MGELTESLDIVVHLKDMNQIKELLKERNEQRE
jgi:hypothetical protein